jgi:signal transduction histidine kinase
MRRVLENLLSNAKKYGTPGSPVKVHIENVLGDLVLTVHNAGPAIPEHEMARLFSTFHRLADIDIKGWGLGLPLVQLVVESHGGTVAVSSAASSGTTFTIQLPADCQACATEA